MLALLAGAGVGLGSWMVLCRLLPGPGVEYL